MSGQKKARKASPTAGLGPRYGVAARKRYGDIIIEMRKKHVCPKCTSQAVRRISVGIWACRKCGFTFTGGAYVPATKLGVSAEQSARSS